MSTYIERMEAEKAELSDKLDKLCAFLGTETYHNLPEESRDLMVDQRYHMEAYVGVLSRRIALAGKEN